MPTRKSVILDLRKESYVEHVWLGYKYTLHVSDNMVCDHFVNSSTICELQKICKALHLVLNINNPLWWVVAINHT